MGRGNVRVRGEYEGLYYISNEDYITLYRVNSDDEDPETVLKRELSYSDLSGKEWQLDEVGSQMEYDYIIDTFKEKFMKRFNSFTPVEKNEWITRDRMAILENGLFYIALEDNGWSTAVELIQKEDELGETMPGLQKRHCQKYLDGIRDCLLEILPEISVRNGPWMSHTIRREDFAV